jgi:hypothetical protein
MREFRSCLFIIRAILLMERNYSKPVDLLLRLLSIIKLSIISQLAQVLVTLIYSFNLINNIIVAPLLLLLNMTTAVVS